MGTRKEKRRLAAAKLAADIACEETRLQNALTDANQARVRRWLAIPTALLSLVPGTAIGAAITWCASNRSTITNWFEKIMT